MESEETRTSEQAGGEGGEGRRAEDVTPDVADDAEKEQTEVPAAGDDALRDADEDPGHA